MLIKIHKAYRRVVTVCDSDLLEKKFEEGTKTLEISENFFKGEEKSESELIEILIDQVKEDATFNIVGKNSIDCAIKAGIISQDGVKTVQGVPFALVLL
ncbi:MAG: DUF424 family protein [Nanoarchaeota archaeon]